MHGSHKNRGGLEGDGTRSPERVIPDERQVVIKGFEGIVGRPPRAPNRLREARLERMLSKAELARKAGVSPLTIARIEEGCPARLETRRKILAALGLPPQRQDAVFFDDEGGAG